MKSAIASAFILASAVAATAHLGTLSDPKANQTFPVGATLAIKWSVDQAHGTQDIAYSKANGPWVNITTGLAARAAAHNWTIPTEAQGSNVRIRICQRNPGGSGCNDTHNSNAPGGASGGVYVLVSGGFTVSAPTPVRSGDASEAGFLSFRPESRSVEAAFTLAAPERVTLEAFDAQGRRVAVLFDARKPEGRHVLSVFSHALNGTTPVMLRLQAGDKVLQQAMQVY